MVREIPGSKDLPIPNSQKNKPKTTPANVHSGPAKSVSSPAAAALAASGAGGLTHSVPSKAVPVKATPPAVPPVNKGPGSPLVAKGPGSASTQFKPANTVVSNPVVSTVKYTDGSMKETYRDGKIVVTTPSRYGSAGNKIETTLPNGTTTTRWDFPSASSSVGYTGGAAYAKSFKPDPRLDMDYRPHFRKVAKAFDAEALRRCCTMGETEFAAVYAMDTVNLPANKDHKEGFYAFKDNGASILAVAHLDTVIKPEMRMCDYVKTAAGPMVFSGALDDRLGAYTILELMPALGITFDVLLTTNEECGDSTAFDFAPPEGKAYNWMIEFDRGGTDTVMYQYEDAESRKLVEDVGVKMGHGSFSDIGYLDFLNVKGFNWGVAYREYHGPRGHAYLNEYLKMMGHFLDFHDAHGETVLPHTKARPSYGKASKLGLPSDRTGVVTDAEQEELIRAWWNDLDPSQRDIAMLEMG